MARTDYQHQLEQLCESVLELSDLVCQRLRRALEAYGRNDTALAERVITGDHAINQLYLEIEGDCIDLLALQQPVASDLRLIASSFKIITDLERVGDLAVNLAEYTQRTTSDRYAEIDITRIGEKTIQLVEDAMQAYARGNSDATHDIAARDDEIDTHCEQASRQVVRGLVDADGSDDTLLEDVSQMLLTIRDLERVGDHAVNIAARTLYMVENDESLIY
ncbi:phosphate signaling complex protein PhoU [Natronolimnobius baerhuensis]|uniref:Phosphate-specific transport system accessory protein PhoU n=1 Tax=Natronolimnobius baerhuensis TaxID=253108 RepID=A0A202E7L3_9EURY|nr:phosphate signaling complex protein PhoU [Natronolimnobius baerhuensis]OVE84252.1 phosphate transport system regulatory protein PhoU [Natronolimnobius baerhuensis]